MVKRQPRVQKNGMMVVRNDNLCVSLRPKNEKRQDEMKKLLTLIVLSVATTVSAKDLHTLVVRATMHCENCTKRIKKAVRLEKGVKSIKPDLENKTVTIIYDSEKGKSEVIIKAIQELGFETSVVSDKRLEKKPATDATTGASPLR